MNPPYWEENLYVGSLKTMYGDADIRKAYYLVQVAYSESPRFYE